MTPKRAQQPGAPRLDGVDLIRGLALLSVLLNHINIFARLEDAKVGQFLPAWLWCLTFNSGLLGVSAFFVVSGFVITLTSIRRFGSLDRVPFGKFYWIRFARIAPPLLLVLVVLSTLHVANIDRFRINPAVCGLPRAILAVLAFHVNWLETGHGWLPACWTVFWSLSVEGVFYLAYPAACALLLLRRWGKLGFFGLMGLLIVAGPAARVLTADHIWRQQSYLANMDGIAIGCLCGIVTDWCATNRKLTESRWALISQIVGISAVLLIALYPWLHETVGWELNIARIGIDVTISLLGTALFLWGSFLRGRKGAVIWRPMRWFGRHSYEIYLSHEFVVVAVLPLFLEQERGPEILWIALVIGVASFIGYIFARFFSEPINQKSKASRGFTSSMEHILNCSFDGTR